MQCPHPIHLRRKDDDGFINYISVPCGKCPICLSNRKRDWVFRLKKEMSNCDSSYFVTLTYDDDHLPRDGLLCKRDVQLFLKRLRKYIYPFKVRYFYVGEYGDETMRPHYHLLLFNFPHEFDLKCALRDTWQLCSPLQWNLDGVIGSVTGQSINYVASYCTKLYPDGRKNICGMSRRPAIGSSYLTEDTKQYHKETLNLVSHDFKNTYRLPRYYRDKIFNDYEKAFISYESKKYQKKQEKKWERQYGINWRFQRFNYLFQKEKDLKERSNSKH